MSTYLGNQLLSGVATNTISNAHSLFDFKWTDHILNEMSWLRADTFSWHNGLLYKGAYNHLVEDYSEYSGVTGISDGSHIYEKDDSANIVDRETTYYAWTYSGTSVYTTTENPTIGSYTVDAPGVITLEIEITEIIGDVQTETVGSYTIAYYQATDGHKIVSPDQETTVQNIYNESGVAWYYILDTTNQRFKLPRENPAREELIDYIKAPVVGNGYGLTLTNGSQTLGLAHDSASATTAIGGTNQPYSIVGSSTSRQNTQQATTLGVPTASQIGSDLTKSGIETLLSSSTKTSVYKGKKYLYFYVGEYSQSAAEQTAGITIEQLNDKLDADAGNATSTGKQTIVGWGMPDYSAGITKSATSYTETMNGFIVVDYTSDTYSQFRITIDGVEFRFYQGYSGTDYNHCNVGFVPIPKGKQYTINDMTNCRVRFFPCVGE